MDGLIHFIIKHKRSVVITFVALALISACCIPFVRTNYSMVDYLPDEAQSTQALALMDEEFSQEVPNVNVMVRAITIPEALSVKGELARISGVSNVMWLDDVVDIHQPLETLDAATVETYYKRDDPSEDPSLGIALLQATVEDGYEATAVLAMRELVDDIARSQVEAGLITEEEASGWNAVSGDAADTAQMQASTVEEVLGAVAIIVPIILFLLIVSTLSWIEPLLFVAAIGISILLNMGTNIFLGEVSFITYSVSPILQLAVSLDYAIFLLHAFADERRTTSDVREAMAKAMRRSTSTIAASAITTLFGFAALSFMQFQIGADLGINLVKGIAFSFITVVIFLPALTLYLYKLIDRTAHRLYMPTFSNVDRALSRIRIPALVLVIVLIVPAFLGQAHTAFTYQNAEPDPGIRNGADTLAITEEFGNQNAMVILVPRGDVATETMLAQELDDLVHVKSVLSFASTVGAEIPEEFLDEAIRDQFYSDGWTRIIVYLDTPFESAEAFDAVRAVQDTTGRFYATYYTAGQSANLYDMSNIIEMDNVRVSVIAVIAIFVVLLITFRSLGLPLVLLLTIESGIWINLAIPYFMGESINFIGYLVINTVQLGATIDYGILVTSRYVVYRKRYPARMAVKFALGDSFRSVLVSAAILATAGFALAATSSLSAVASLGLLLGRGAILSLIMVTCFLPGLLIYLDGFIRKTTLHADFYGRSSLAGIEPSSDRKADR